MKRTYKFRIYPTRVQRLALDAMLGFCRFLYNCALEERISYYKRFGKSLSYVEQSKALPGVRKEFASETGSILAQSLQQVLMQLDQSYKNFFRRVKGGEEAVGFPRFKGKDRFRSICFPQPDPDLKAGCIVRRPSGQLSISKLGDLKVRWHRELPKEARCKQVRLVKQADQYYIVISCDGVAPQPIAMTGKTIGIDMGITPFLTMDDGTQFHHPKPYKTAKEKLAYLNRRLAAKQRGSRNREKSRTRLARAHQKVYNVRQDFQHKLASQLMRENDVIVIEKLNVKGMLEAKGFEVSKGNISDASWGSFAALLSYKAESAGKTVIEVDPRNTSKMCSKCQNVNKELTLRDRIYHCQACGLTMNRDRNAALNIRRLGTSLVEQGAALQSRSPRLSAVG